MQQSLTVVKCEPEDQEDIIVMPEGPHSTSNSPLRSMEHKLSSRKNSNLSTCSDDSLRKISTDSGISVASAHLAGLAGMLPSAGSMEDLIGEPRLSSAAAMQSMLAQQAMSSQLAAMNPAMLGMQQAAYAGLWTNPLAAMMMQQQAAAQKILESSGHGKTSTSSNSSKQYPKEPFAVYPGFPNLLQQSSSPTGNNSSSSSPNSALSDVVKYQEQLISSYKSQLMSRKPDEVTPAAVKPHRKSHSYSGLGTAPSFNRQLSPHHGRQSIASPQHTSNGSKFSPNYTKHTDEQHSSIYGDDDSVCSGQSARSRTPQPTPSSNISVSPTPNTADILKQNNSLTYSNGINPQHLQTATASRKRKNGFYGSLPMSDLSAAFPSGQSAFTPQNPGALPTAGAADIPFHKLSTASLPAMMPSITPKSSSCSQYESTSPTGRGSGSTPATSRKRKPASVVCTEEKVGPSGKDELYWERRRKNNEAAKRSRDSRRAKEDEIAIKAAFLEQENLRLRVEMSRMKEELTTLKSDLEEARSGVKPAPSSAESKSPTVENNNSEVGGDEHDRPISQLSTEKASSEHSQPCSPALSADGSKASSVHNSTDE